MADAAPSPLDHINPVVRSSEMTAHSILKADTAGSPAPLTVPEGTVLGRRVGGGVAALTPAEVATILSTPSSSTIGNLLTANQSTPATGQLTLSGCTEATGLVLTASGSGAYTALVSGVAVTVGQVYTVSASLAPTGRAAAVRISWRNAGGSEVSAVAGDTIAAGATGTSMAVGVAPATAVTMYAYAAYASTGSAGDAVTVTKFGAWAGAGGLWSPPGVPITGTGRRTTHPNTDDVLVQAWDSTQGRWQVAHYDSGWRDVATLLTSFTGAGDGARLRRVGGTVFLAIRGTFNGLSVNVSNFFTQPSGFTSSFNTYGVIGVVTDGSTAVRHVDEGATGNVLRFRTNITADGVSTCGWLSWPTSDAIPTSLPGTLVSSAPYN